MKPIIKGIIAENGPHLRQLNEEAYFRLRTVWPEKNRQMSVKVAQK